MPFGFKWCIPLRFTFLSEQRYLIKSVSLKIEPLQYIAIYYNGSIFNETDFISLHFFLFHSCNEFDLSEPSYMSIGVGLI